MINEVAQIVDERGGASVFARTVGKTPGAVRVWKHRNCFPREAWPEIIKAFPELDLDRLMQLEAVAAGEPADVPRPAPAEVAA